MLVREDFHSPWGGGLGLIVRCIFILFCVCMRAMYCVESMLRCVVMGRMCVSACKWDSGAMETLPVVIRSALFCIVCKCCMFVCEAIFDQTGEA